MMFGVLGREIRKRVSSSDDKLVINKVIIINSKKGKEKRLFML